MLYKIECYTSSQLVIDIVKSFNCTYYLQLLCHSVGKYYISSLQRVFLILIEETNVLYTHVQCYLKGPVIAGCIFNSLSISSRVAAK